LAMGPESRRSRAFMSSRVRKKILQLRHFTGKDSLRKRADCRRI
jgi:hypothetical protein